MYQQSTNFRCVTKWFFFVWKSLVFDRILFSNCPIPSCFCFCFCFSVYKLEAILQATPRQNNKRHFSNFLQFKSPFAIPMNENFNQNIFEVKASIWFKTLEMKLIVLLLCCFSKAAVVVGRSLNSIDNKWDNTTLYTKFDTGFSKKQFL